MTYEYTKNTLKNGLEVIIEPRPERKVTGIEMMVKTGSNYQNENNRGIIHLLEHLLGNGSENYPGRSEAEEEIAKRGGILSMCSSVTNVTIEGIVNSKDQEELIKSIIDIGFRSKLNYLEEEKKIIESEISEYKDDEEIISLENLDKIMYENDYLLDVTGKIKPVNSFEIEQIKEVYEDLFHPNNTSIAIVGPVEEEKILSKIEDLTNDFERKNQPKREKLKPTNKFEEKIEKKDCVSTYLQIGIHLPKLDFNSGSYWNFQMINKILGSSSDLNLLLEKLRKENNLVYYIKSFLQNYRDAYSMGIETNFYPKNQKEVEKSIKKVIDSFPKNITEKKLRDIKKYYRGYEKISRDKVNFEASKLNKYNLYNNLDYLDKRMDIIENLKLEEIKRTSEKYLNSNKLYKSIVKPK